MKTSASRRVGLIATVRASAVAVIALGVAGCPSQVTPDPNDQTPPRVSLDVLTGVPHEDPSVVAEEKARVVPLTAELNIAGHAQDPESGVKEVEVLGNITLVCKNGQTVEVPRRSTQWGPGGGPTPTTATPTTAPNSRLALDTIRHADLPRCPDGSAAPQTFGWFSVKGTNTLGQAAETARFTFASGNCEPAYGTFGPGRWPQPCWRPYDPSSPFNQRIPGDARTHPNSAAIVQRITGDLSQHKYPNHLVAYADGNAGEPTYYSTGTDPIFVIRCKDDPEGRLDGTCPLEGQDIRIPAHAVPERGSSDQHMTIVDQSANLEYDLWQAKALEKPDGSQVPIPADGLPDTGGTLVISWGGQASLTGSGMSDPPPPGKAAGNATAAHFANLAGRVRAEELALGHIPHALFIVINCDNGTAVYPARGKGRKCANTTNAPPMGARLQLQMSRYEIETYPGAARWQKALMRAMAEYGMFFGDTGSSGYFTIEQEAGSQYTAVGGTDRWLQVATNQKWSLFEGNYAGHLDTLGIDWPAKLRVLDPCTTDPTC